MEQKFKIIRHHIQEGHVKVMIIGLGSVGTYLLDYLISSDDPSIQVIVVGRDYDKMVSNVNIVKVGSLIRRQNRTRIEIQAGIDLNYTDQIAECIGKWKPDIVVNSSRVYSGLKYGSISWKTVRAYGIWSPLAVKYIKNIMAACSDACASAIVINTSYSDATIPWLKSAGCPYPELGSGNLNHLIPRIKFAVSEKMKIGDYWNLDVVLSTAHFHDVVISKEGHTEGMEQLLRISYHGNVLDLDQKEIFSACKIPMPVDAKRNIMNASSNYELIRCIIEAVRNDASYRVFSPGVDGEIGGYPVLIDGSHDRLSIRIDQTAFSMEEMKKANRRSILYDGIEDIRNGCLVYSDELIDKVFNAFRVRLPKEVRLEDSEETAEFIIENIIKPNMGIA